MQKYLEKRLKETGNFLYRLEPGNIIHPIDVPNELATFVKYFVFERARPGDVIGIEMERDGHFYNLDEDSFYSWVVQNIEPSEYQKTKMYVEKQLKELTGAWERYGGYVDWGIDGMDVTITFPHKKLTGRITLIFKEYEEGPIIVSKVLRSLVNPARMSRIAKGVSDDTLRKMIEVDVEDALMLNIK